MSPAPALGGTNLLSAAMCRLKILHTHDLKLICHV